MKITNVKARSILDSRGNPTVEVEICLDKKYIGVASTPSGASTGSNEALELRDKNKDYFGLGVKKAINNINDIVIPTIINKSFFSVREFDEFLIKLDGTNNKSRIGANGILPLSIAFLKAMALMKKKEIYSFIDKGKTIPKCMFNILNGGMHSDSGLSFQEFMIIPNSNDINEQLLIANSVFNNLKKTLIDKGLSVSVGDEGGFAPKISGNFEALDLIVHAIKLSGYDVSIAIDVAASSFYSDGKYNFDGKSYTPSKLCDYYLSLIDKYPIISIEDPFYEEDFVSFALLTSKSNIQIVGDDLFTTNVNRLKKGIIMKACNAIIIKPNQIGTITEVMDVIKIAKANDYDLVISHRSGETEDTFIADLAVSVNAKYMKAGSICRGERISKYNRLIRISEQL